MRIVSVHEAKTQLSSVLVAVEAGESVIIARNNHPIAKLVPLEVTPRTFGTMSFTVPDDFDAPLPDDELELWQ